MVRTFWFHYHKQNSKRAGKPQLTVHYNKACHVVDNIVCKVAVTGHIRRDQPQFVIKGKCQEFYIKDNIAYLN